MRSTVNDRHTALLRYAKRELPTATDDPFGDKELFDKECARYFALSGDKVEIDQKAKGKRRLIVHTDMFG
jgi:hypothetical protein